MGQPVAAIDCGTNSIRLLITDQGRELARQMRIVRLGQGVDRTGELDAAAIERTRAALAEYRKLTEAHRVRRVRMVATSATRDVANAADFHQMVRDTLGQPAEVISGSEEAALSFSGAVADLPPGTEYLVIDIGGGSTEFVRGVDSPENSISVDIGCVRMTERRLHSDPPAPDQVAAAERDIAAAIEQALDVVGRDPATLVGLAGTVTTIGAIALDLPSYQRDIIHHSVLSADAVERVTARLLALDHDARAAIPVMHPGRVDVIIGGALILRAVLRQTAAKEIIVSEHDILDGIAASIQR